MSNSDLEVDLIDALHGKNRVLKYALALAGVVIVTLAASQAYVVTRPQPEPMKFAVDQRAGFVDRIVSGEPIEFSERMVRGQLAEYIKMCETYVYDGLVMYYDYCMLHSGEQRQQQYAAAYEGPDSRQVKWGRERVVRVDPQGGEGGVPMTINLRSANTAYVWFTTEEKSTNGGKPTRQNWGAEIVYRVLENVKMNERDMLTNYTLFEVVSYTKERLP